jgi:hypothetical protein
MILLSCGSVVKSPSRDSVVILPSRDSVVISPSCNSVVILPLHDSVVISPSRTSIVISSSRNSVRIGYLNTVTVFCMRLFLYGAWFFICCVRLSFAIRPKKCDHRLQPFG